MRGRPGVDMTAMRGRMVFRVAVMMVVMVAGVARVGMAQAVGPSQVDVQAVYLFDFAKFVRWPEGAEHGPLTICVAGQKSYVDALAKLTKGEQIDGRALGVRAIVGGTDVGGCDIVFVGDAAKDRLDEVVSATAGKPVLTVSDAEGFLDRGGMIQFVLLEKRVRFSVDLRPVGKSGIGLSSELLKVAVKVNGVGGAR